ncbi:hypothetical protein ACWGI9_41830 [Streptomyces sp. NPDC054833]
MKDLCPQGGEPFNEAEEDWLFGDGPVPQTPPWSTSEPAVGWPVQYEGDDGSSAGERFEDEDPDPGVLADGRPAKIPSATRDRLWIYGYFTLKRMIRDGEIFEKWRPRTAPCIPLWMTGGPSRTPWRTATRSPGTP